MIGTNMNQSNFSRYMSFPQRLLKIERLHECPKKCEWIVLRVKWTLNMQLTCVKSQPLKVRTRIIC